MKYYTNGGKVIARLLTSADSGPELLGAQAQTWNFKRSDWVDVPAGKTAEILFSGDYDECSDDDARKAIAAAEKQLKLSA